MLENFSITWRNPGHWDIYSEKHGRLFCIRGKPGAVVVRDERERGIPNREGFPTVGAAMMWICATLMYEPNEET